MKETAVEPTHRGKRPKLKTDNFDASVVEAAHAYHMHIGIHHVKGHTRIDVAAFIAGACWAREVLVDEKKE